NRYRLALASNISETKQAPAERNISGTIQATVDDKKPAAQTPDKLTLSKGSVQSAADLEQMALARTAADNAKRAAQISQNTNELNQLAQTVASMAAANAASGAATGAAAPLAAAPASVPGVQKPVAPAVPATAPVTPAASGFLDELTKNPLLPAAGAALLVLLAGLGMYKVRQRQQKKSVDSSFMESGFHAESFFGDSGGQKVDTQETSASSSSMMYSASQLDAVEEADPVAEADVYLAYGRDLQAEEVLREALLAQPERVAIHQKLLAIFAKRQDAKAYAMMAALVYPLLKNNEPQWSAICDSGLALEPGNPMYLAGGRPAAEVPPSMPSPLPAIPLAAAEVARAEPAKAVEDSALDLDFDLDFSLDEPKPVAAAEPAQTALPVIPEAALPVTPTASAPSPVVEMAPIAATGQAADLLEFDFDSLSLELDDSDLVPTRQPSLVSTEALESKLAMAEEFKANGDNEAARALMQQVINEADDTLKARAQQALSQL
ncbi:MAG: hypothetical protein PSV24_08110, partial [Rhodoferax sp.]|nr:hypothetical protein [Rhodoferax sp.]